jgi:pyruvate dehydrogenase E1 component
VIKVIWGRQWDELLERDVDGALVARMNEVPDGQMQTYTAKGAAFVREDFFGANPQLQRLIDPYDDAFIERLTRGGHDYHKVYAAFDAATKTPAPRR